MGGMIMGLVLSVHNWEGFGRGKPESCFFFLILFIGKRLFSFCPFMLHYMGSTLLDKPSGFFRVLPFTILLSCIIYTLIP